MHRIIHEKRWDATIISMKAYEIEISVKYTITYINNPESLLIQLSTDRPYGHNAHTVTILDV